MLGMNEGGVGGQGQVGLRKPLEDIRSMENVHFSMLALVGG